MVLSKSSQRRLAYDARNAQPEREHLSQIITAKVLTQDVYQQAETVLWYLHCRSEVQTYQAVLSELQKQRKTVVIPYCTKDKLGHHHLGLWHLEDISELSAGTWGILEPPRARWGEPGKEVSPEQIDLVVVPGVAFDRQGGRLGNGAGYYDRMFARLSAQCILLGIAFASQIFQEIIMQQHDVYMHGVMTETHFYNTL